MSELKELYNDELEHLIVTSSYIKKHMITKKINEMSREELEELYNKCRDYACESIVNNLMGFDDFKHAFIYHMHCNIHKFYILARVRTNWENPTIEQTADNRSFLSFTILTEKNLSHFPGRVIYGYHTGIKPSMIGYICHHDANTSAHAHTRLELSDLPEELLDIEDLCDGALRQQTYCQVSIRSQVRNYYGPIIEQAPLLPEAVISIDRPTDDDLLASRTRNLPILVIHRGNNTIMNVRDYFSTPELSNPHYL